MKAIILAGGMGTRLRDVIKDVPKPLAPVDGKPFLEYLILQLKKWKVEEVILSVGYKKEIIKTYFGNGSQFGMPITYSEENEPLGTGGALKNAAPRIEDPYFMVMNGDSICPVDFSRFHAFHLQKGGIISLVLVKSQSGQDYGVVEVDDNQRVTSFREKNECQKTMLINGGIYFMKRDIFDHMPVEARFSLEYDLFPKILHLGCYGFRTNSEVIDIGTPERYVQALRRLSPSNSNKKLL